MLKRLNTYRHLLLSLLLVSYVLSAFPRPFFEGLHLVAHTAEFIQASYEQHSLHDHNGGDHHHHHLEVAEANTKHSDEKKEATPANDLKKKLEISDQEVEVLPLTTAEIDNNFGVLLTLKTTYPDLISPPPQDLA